MLRGKRWFHKVSQVLDGINKTKITDQNVIKLIKNLNILYRKGWRITRDEFWRAKRLVQNTTWYKTEDVSFMLGGNTLYHLHVNALLKPELFTYIDPKPAKKEKIKSLFSPYSDDDLTEREKGLALFRILKTDSTITPVEAATPALARAFSLWLSLLKKNGVYERQKQRIEDVLDWLKYSNWKEGLDWISSLANKDGYEDYIYFTNLLTMNGWVEIDLTDDQLLIREAETWFSNVVNHTWDGDIDRWRNEWELAFEELFSNTLLDVTLDHELSMLEYLQDPLLWGRSGSSYDPYLGEKYYVMVPLHLYPESSRHGLRVVQGSGGREYVLSKASNSKWASAFAYDSEELEKELRLLKPAYSRTFWKRAETKKQRSIVSGDLYTFLIMDYIEVAWLKKAFKDDNRSTLWMSKSQTWEMWEKFSKISGIAVPLDQSSFDANQGKWEVMRAMHYFKDKAPKFLKEWFEILLVRMENMIIEIPLHAGTTKRIAWDNGIPSGLRWTAFLDTIMNLVTNRMVRNKLSYQGYTDETTLLVAQGDDDLIRVRSWKYAALLWQEYTHMGYIIHPGKFFISDSRDEFLRKVAVSHGLVTGMAPRSINSILWRNPENDPLPKELSRLNGIAAKWKICIDRFGLNLEDCLHWVVQDLVGSTGARQQDVTDWLFTPRSYGGFGSSERVPTRYLKVIPETYSFQGIKATRTPGIDQIVLNAKHIRLLEGDDYDRQIDNFVLDTLDVTKWIKSRKRITQSRFEQVQSKPFIRGFFEVNTDNVSPQWDLDRYYFQIVLDSVGYRYLDRGFIQRQLGVFNQEEQVLRLFPKPDNSTRRVWKDYVLAGAEGISKVVPGFGVEFTSFLYREKADQVISWLSRRRRANSAVYQDALAAIELQQFAAPSWRWVA